MSRTSILLFTSIVMALSGIGCGSLVSSEDEVRPIEVRPIADATAKRSFTGTAVDLEVLVELEALAIEMYPGGWRELQQAFATTDMNLDPRPFKDKHRWGEMAKLPPREFALMTRAVSQQIESPAPYFNAIKVGSYLYKSPMHVGEVIKIQMYASNYRREAIQNLCFHPSTFPRPIARAIWSDALVDISDMAAPYCTIVRTYSGVLEGTAAREDVAQLIAELADNGRDMYEHVLFILGNGEASHVEAFDEALTRVLTSHDRRGIVAHPSYAGLASAELFSHGYPRSLVAYAQSRVDGRQGNYDSSHIVRKIVPYVACSAAPRVPAVIGRGRHLAEAQDGVKREVEAFMTYLVSDEFARASWHSGLQLWMDG